MNVAVLDAKVIRSVDPGRTRKIRKAFSASANMQLNKLRAMLRQAVVEYNILGLSGPSNFTFMTPAARLQQFAGFLETAANASLDARWWVHPWIDRATQHGLKSAQAEMGGQEHQPIPTTFESLHQISHDELRGIIGALVQKVMRVAHAATSRGMVPHQAFRELMKPIDGDIRNRLKLLTHLLTVKGHVKGKVAYYRHNGITHVGVNPELRLRKAKHDHALFDKRRKKRDDVDEVSWATAEDDDVCEDCQDMADGGPYSLDEVEDLIPLHALCRCDLVIWNDSQNDSAIQFRCDAFYDDFDPDEERDEHGRWGSGGSEISKIEGLPADANFSDESLRQAIDRGAFEMKATERHSAFIRPGEVYDVMIGANPTTDTVSYLNRKDDKMDSLYDPKLADLKTFDAGTAIEYQMPVLKPGFKDTITPLPDKDIIYRGISADEYEYIQKTGFVKSKGEYNIGEEEKGLTFWSPRTETAETYSNSFAPWQYKATFEKPAYIIAMKKPSADRIMDRSHITMDDEVAVKGSISKSEIVATFIGKPYDSRAGYFELRRLGQSNEYKIGSRGTPTSRLSWSLLEQKK